MSSIEAKPVVYPHFLALDIINHGPALLPSRPVFRSQLEADWANTLDELRIEWAYEPQLFTLPSGQQYLPDFHLPELDTWLEVKGPGVPRIEKALAFARWRAPSLIVAGRSPWFEPPRRFTMRFQGTAQRCGLALCPDCHRYQWSADFACRACHAPIPEDNFYKHHAAPFHPAQWSGE